MHNVVYNGVTYVVPDQGDNYPWAAGYNSVPGLTALVTALAGAVPVQSLSVVSHKFLTGISAAGVVTQAQPAFSDISGNIGLTQLPAPYTQWDQAASTTPGVGSFTSFLESGITGQAFSVDTSAGSSLKITQTAGDASWAHIHGYLTNAPTTTDYRVRATFKLKGATFADAVNRFGIGARASVVSNVLSGWALTFLSGNIYLTKRVSGVYTEYYTSGIAIGTVLPAMQPKDSLRLELDVYGNFVTAYANGVLLWRTYDAAFSGGVGAVFAEPAAAGSNQAIAMVDYLDVIPRVPPAGF